MILILRSLLRENSRAGRIQRRLIAVTLPELPWGVVADVLVSGAEDVVVTICLLLCELMELITSKLRSLLISFAIRKSKWLKNL